MKRVLGLTLGLMLALPAVAAADWVQASGSTSQTVSEAGEVVVIDLIDTIDGIEATDEGFVVTKAGAYFIVAAPQATTGGSFRAWLTLNGEDVSNSNVLLSGPTQDVIISQGIVPLEKGDVVGVKAAGGTMEALSPAGEPLVPSIIFSMFGPLK